jgi:tetratricopeptide (TPR) repeat protein
LAHALLADLDSFAGRQVEATKELEESLKVDPDNPDTLNQAAWLYATAQDPDARNFQKALDYAKRAVAATHGRNTDYLDTLAEAYWVNRRYQDAARQYEEMIRIDPMNAEYLNEAAWLYATVGDPQVRNPQKAVQYAREAVACSHEKDPAILDTLAEAYYVGRQYNDAIQTEKKAMALSPTDQVQPYKDHLKKYKRAQEESR